MGDLCTSELKDLVVKQAARILDLEDVVQQKNNTITYWFGKAKELGYKDEVPVSEVNK